MSREMDVHARMVELAERILLQTLDNKIRWVETDQDDQYLYPASVSGVLIERHDGQYESTTYHLTLLNADGKAVQELHEGTVEGATGESMPGPWNETLERLFDAARREALGIDGLLDKTLRDIDDGVSKTDRTRKMAKKEVVDFDDPWATAAPKPKPRSSVDEPPF